MSERVKKLPYFASWEVKKCVDRLGRSFAEKKIPRACYFRPSCFLLEVRSAGKFENFPMFRWGGVRVGMLCVRKAATCKGCIVVSEGCCSFNFYVDFCVNIFLYHVESRLSPV